MRGGKQATLKPPLWKAITPPHSLDEENGKGEPPPEPLDLNGKAILPARLENEGKQKQQEKEEQHLAPLHCYKAKEKPATSSSYLAASQPACAFLHSNPPRQPASPTLPRQTSFQPQFHQQSDSFTTQ